MSLASVIAVARYLTSFVDFRIEIFVEFILKIDENN